MTIETIAPRIGALSRLLALASAGMYAYAQTPENGAAAAAATPPAQEAQQTSTSRAASGSAPSAELPPVTVSAHDSLEVPYDQTGVSVTVLDIAQLRKQGVNTLPDALTTVPGMYVLPGGGDTQRGNITSASVRGLSKSAYILPLIDGMRIYAAGNGNPGANALARTNLLDLGVAEVLRGSEGATYGNGCMGAVLYLTTPKGEGKPSASTFHEAGSHDSYTGNFTAQGEKKDLAYFVSTTYEHTNNDLRYDDGTRPPQKHAGRYSSYNQALRLDGKVDDKNTLTFTYRRQDSDFTDASNPATPATRYEFRSNLVTAAWSAKLSDKWTSKLMAGYFGYDASFGGGTASDLRNIQAEWRNSYKWGKMSASTFGLCWLRSDYNASDTYSRDSGLQNTYSAFAEHTFSIVPDWETSLAARLDSDSVVDEEVTLRLSSVYKTKDKRYRFYGSVGTGYNAPSQFQRSRMTYHSPFGGDWTGNPALHCEHSVSADLGVERKMQDKHYIAATLFWTRTWDAISADYSGYPFSYRNASGHQTSQGVELSARGTWEQGHKTGYNVALTLTQPTRDGSQIPNSARQTLTADVHTCPIEKLTTGIGLTAATRRTGYDGAKLDNYYTLRCYATYEVTDNLTLHLRVENLTNQKFITQPGYADPVFGYPSTLGAGVSVYGGCSYKF